METFWNSQFEIEFMHCFSVTMFGFFITIPIVKLLFSEGNFCSTSY